MTREILRISNLRIVTRAGNAETAIVEGVSLDLRRGEVLGLIGESGAGKSTIGLAALSYARPGCKIDGGDIIFDGMRTLDLSRAGRRDLRGRRVAYVAQSAAASFNPAKRIIAQVCEMPVRHGMATPRQAKERAIALFRELNLPSPETFGQRYPHQVSGGQLQRAMLAMAMSCQPDILVLDEPTTALDVTTQIEVLAAIRAMIQEHQTAALYISHDLAVVAQIANRIIVLRDGRTVETGDVGEILHRPNEDYTRRLTSVHSGRPSCTQAPPSGTPSILVAKALCIDYGVLRAVHDVTLDVRIGETLAIVGESGSGKSTLARSLCGLKPFSAGSASFDGQALAPTYSRRPREQLRRIQLVYQSPDIALNPRQSVGEILGRPLSFYFGHSRPKARARVEELLELIDLPASFVARYPGELSGGQKQRVCIARALAASPDLIICDEVTASLDPLVAQEILQLLSRIQAETGVAFIFITHDLGIVRDIAHRVVVMQRGEIIDQGTFTEVFDPPRRSYTELLLSSVPEMRVDWLDNILTRRGAGASALLQQPRPYTKSP